MIPWYGRIPVLLVISLFILVVDFLISPLISFPLTFLFPATIAAWWHPRPLAIGLTVGLVIIRFVNILYWQATPPSIFIYALTNSGVRLVVLLLIVYLIAHIAEQQRQLQHKVQMLEGLLSICAYCKKIRTEKETWEQIESYITRQSDVLFSHTICPSCRVVHFGDTKTKQAVPVVNGEGSLLQ